jgi:hypothetical protein
MATPSWMNAPLAWIVGKNCNTVDKPTVNPQDPTMAPSSEWSLLDSLKSEQRKAFYEGHKGVALVMILIVFLAPFVGLAIKGLAGSAIGVVLSIAAYYLAPYIVHNLER